MSVARAPNDIYSNVGKTFSIIACVCIASISIYHIITTLKYAPKKCALNINLSMVLLILAIYTITNLTYEIFDTSPLFCNYTKLVAIPSYILYKCVLYLILVARIYGAFASSDMIIVSPTKLKVWSSIIIIWSIINIILNMLTSTVEFSSDTVPKCITFIWRPVIMLMALLDIIACIVNLYLFIKPVKTIKKMIVTMYEQKDEDIENTKVLQHVAIKQCTLSVVTVITTLIAMIGIAMFSLPQIWVGLDVNISTLCIVLMYKWNDNLLHKLCCLCIRNSEINIKIMNELSLHSTQSNKQDTGTSSQNTEV